MRFDVNDLRDLVRLSLQRPRAAAAQVRALNLPMAARWLALALVAVLSALLVHLNFAVQPAEVQDFFSVAMASPLRTAWLQAVFMLVVVVAVHRLGVWRGGRGSFADALLLMAWLQFLLLGVQIVQLLLYAVLPGLADLFGLVSLVLFFWLLTNFVAELHGFRSLTLVFVGILVAMVGFVVVLALVLGLLIGPQVGA